MEKFEYSTLANRYTARFPALTYIGTQINFWIVANLLFVTLILLQSRITSQALKVEMPFQDPTFLQLAILLGIVIGALLVFVGYTMETAFFRRKSLGKVLALKTLTSLGVLILLLALIRYVFFGVLITRPTYLRSFLLDECSWKCISLMLVVTTFL